jgi:hypothetical protein
MKTSFAIVTALAAGALLAYHPSAFAQGSLTPPGPPGPTMKTLAQIEPRIAITNTGPVTISSPGSYYLTTNITVTSAGTSNGVTIAANNVTLDLNGFTISSTVNPAVGAGILLGPTSGVTNVTILNGFITGGVTNNAGVYNGPGFSEGIVYAAAAPPYNARVSGVSVAGCLKYGIYLASHSTAVESCLVDMIGFYGIYAGTVANSRAEDCYSTGVIAITANNCYGASLSGGGVDADIANCCEGSSSSTGIYGGVNATCANNCYGICYGSGSGINAQVAIGCYAYSDSGTGLSATIANSCYAATGTGTAESVTYKYNMP